MKWPIRPPRYKFTLTPVSTTFGYDTSLSSIAHLQCSSREEQQAWLSQLRDCTASVRASFLTQNVTKKIKTETSYCLSSFPALLRIGDGEGPPWLTFWEIQTMTMSMIPVWTSQMKVIRRIRLWRIFLIFTRGSTLRYFFSVFVLLLLTLDYWNARIP